MNNSIQSLNDAITQLKECSKDFLDTWKINPQRAKWISDHAMICLDHITLEILRERDSLKEKKTYDGSLFEKELNCYQGCIAAPVTQEQQKNIISIGYGNASLPFPNKPLKMGKLLNKIKHRKRNGANFRIGVNGEHFFIISLDEFLSEPKSIVEFSIGDFCDHCLRIANLMEVD
jgi:hypothetical protein